MLFTKYKKTNIVEQLKIQLHVYVNTALHQNGKLYNDFLIYKINEYITMF